MRVGRKSWGALVLVSAAAAWACSDRSPVVAVDDEPRSGDESELPAADPAPPDPDAAALGGEPLPPLVPNQRCGSGQYVGSLIDSMCGDCHGAPGSGCAADICYSCLGVQGLIDSGQVVPGDPEASPLYTSMASGRMPPPGSEKVPSPFELEQIALFIARL